jgi:hypothetical protein
MDSSDNHYKTSLDTEGSNPAAVKQPLPGLAEVEYDEFGFIKGYVCPSCGSPIKEAYVDDAGTRWFKCTHCGSYSSKPKPMERLQFERELTEAKRPITLKELNEVLATTVKRDEPAKSLAFLGMLLAQTEEDQYNIAFQAESSTGKSYIPLELVEYFPEEEKRIYGGASPTSFFHEVGVWDKERRVIRVDLAHKILIFLDQPHWMLMEKLRPLLSHDRKILTYKITDKREKAGLRTKTVELIGYPSVVFCTAKPTQEEQEKTRLWLLSPETSQEKLRESLWLIAKKECNREAFRQWLEQDPKRRWLKRRVGLIRASGIRNVVIPNEEQIFKRYLNGRSSLKPRDQRDFPRLLRIIKGLALLNCFHRKEVSPGTIEASREDIEEAFKLYRMIAPSNELGLSPETYEIYVQVIVPLASENHGISRKEIQKRYYEVFYRPLQDHRLRQQILPSLESAGLIRQEPNPDNKREILIYPTVPLTISSMKMEAPEPPGRLVNHKYSEQNSGVRQKPSLEPSKDIECTDVVSISAAQSLSATHKMEKPALADVVSRLRAEFNHLTEEEWLQRMVMLGLTREEACSLFEKLKGEALFWHDEDGRTVWSWA